MKKEELCAWLFKNGGPVIRYRAATELLPQKASLDIGRLSHEICCQAICQIDRDQEADLFIRSKRKQKLDGERVESLSGSSVVPRFPEM